MTTVTKTASQCVDECVERLPFLRRRITQRAFRRNPNLRAEVVERTMLALSDNEEVQAMGLATGFASGAIGADTPFSIDLDNLERLFAIIMEYLPQILELILKSAPLFMSVLLFALSISMAMPAKAQEVIITQETGWYDATQCADGVCSPSDLPTAESVVPSAGQPVTMPSADCQCEDCQCGVATQTVAPIPLMPIVVREARPIQVATTVVQRTVGASAVIGRTPLMVAANTARRVRIRSANVVGFFQERRPIRSLAKAPLQRIRQFFSRRCR